jgi:hypothetical protein
MTFLMTINDVLKTANDVLKTANDVLNDDLNDA